MSDDYNPQLEDGYIRISNEFHRALTRTRYPGRIKDFVNAVIRYTWGFNDTWREITTEQLCDYMNCSDTQMREARAGALRHNLIEVELSETNNGPARYRVQKMYLEWLSYDATPQAKQRAQALRHVPATDAQIGSPGRAGEGSPGRADEGSPGRAGDPTYNKKDKKKDSERQSTPPVTEKQRRLEKRQALLAEQAGLLADIPQAHRELIEGFIENAAAENGTGTITLNREVSETRALLALRLEIGPEAWCYGMFQANGKRVPNINYVKKAAGSYRPGSSNGGIAPDSPLLKMRGPARAEAFRRDGPLAPPDF